TQSEVQRQVATNFPLVLCVQVPRIASEMIVVLAKLYGCLLRKSEQEIRKVITSIWNRHSVRGRGSIQSREYKAPTSIAVRFCIELDAAKISSPAEGVFCVRPDHGIGESPGLISQQFRVGVLKTSKVGE